MVKKPKIEIKPENKGLFTEYCKRKGLGDDKAVTQKCIEEGKKSKDPDVRKRAVFAENARKFRD